MNRRDVLAMLGGTLFLSGTLAARAQTARSVRQIGVLSLSVRPEPAEIHRLWMPTRELGWIEGQNLIVERRYAGDRMDLLRRYAEELVRLKVEIIVTNGTAATVAAKNATTRIPIVMVSAFDPVRTGLVASLARPGGNVTGFSSNTAELEAKRLTLLRELLPAVQRVGALVNPTNPYYEITREERERVYRSLGMQPIFVAVAQAGELESVVAETARRGAQALVVTGDALFNLNGELIMRSALRHALPTVVANRGSLEAGGFLSLTSDEGETSRALAYFVDKILRGTQPAQLPVQQPTKFVLSINLKTAKALGITIPQSMLLRADEVIQ